MKKEISFVCPRCVECEVKIVAEGRIEGPFEKAELYHCDGCGWMGNEKALFVKGPEYATAEHRGIVVDAGVAYALKRDEDRGEHGGGGSSGSSRTQPPKGPIRSEQDALLFGDEGERSVQAFLRDQVFGAKFLRQEGVQLEAAIAHSGLGKSRWIQRALLAKARAEIEERERELAALRESAAFARVGRVARVGRSRGVSTLRHYVILVTDSRKETEAAHKKAKELGLTVSEINEETFNFRCTFCVFPHGSKEGYEDSIAYHAKRQEFLLYLRDACPDWVEVCYGTDDGMARISADAWDTDIPQICSDCLGTKLQPGRKEKECDMCEGLGYIEK